MRGQVGTPGSIEKIPKRYRSKRTRFNHTQAGPVVVTHPDGTKLEHPPYTPAELARITTRNRRRRSP